MHDMLSFYLWYYKVKYYEWISWLSLHHLGLEVRAFVRDKAKIPEDLRNKVEAVVGDVTNAKEVANAVAGRDAVIVVLGTREDLSKQYIYFLIFIHLLLLIMICCTSFYAILRPYYCIVSRHEEYNRCYESTWCWAGLYMLIR